MKKFFLICLICFTFQQSFAQQNKIFAEVKTFYNTYRAKITQELKSRIPHLTEPEQRQKLFLAYGEVMKKIDSIENQDFIAALITTKNLEQLKRLPKNDSLNTFVTAKNVASHTRQALYPGGINTLRQQLPHLFYMEALPGTHQAFNTLIRFAVEKDGSISHVTAKGKNPYFNRQAEIAVYLLPEKFTPKFKDGKPVRSLFALPLKFKMK